MFFKKYVSSLLTNNISVEKLENTSLQMKEKTNKKKKNHLLSQQAEMITVYVYWSISFRGFSMHIDTVPGTQ